MARINNFAKQKVKSMNQPEGFDEKSSAYKKKKVKKRVPTQEELKRQEREKAEMARREEKKRIQGIMAHDSGDSFEPVYKAENLPLREAVLLSEIIGQPRCKSRHRRRN